MQDTNLIARDNECKMLQRCLDSNRSELVTICGRRRIGKTYLVEEFFDGRYDFSYVGIHKATKQIQLRAFGKAIKQYFHLSAAPKLSNWFVAFDVLEDFLSTITEPRKKVIFIDEMPWIDTLKSEFVMALENFWNGWANRRRDIVLVASGSATSWMKEKLEGNKGGLHARITCKIALHAFTLAETEEYLRRKGCAWDRYQIVQCYMVLGGTPFYLSLIDENMSWVENMDNLFFSPNACLKDEFDELYCALFNKADRYIAVVKMLAEHKEGMTLAEIKAEYTYPQKKLLTILKNLERCDFIEQYNQFGNKKRERIYRLVDFYTLFYYQFQESNHSKDPHWWSMHFASPQVYGWQGRSFEMVCMKHVEQIKAALGISGIAAEVSAWRKKSTKTTKGAQIDMLIDRADRMVNLCEMKFSMETYLLTEKYEAELRERMGLFREATQTKKGVNCVFVTTFGVANAKAHSIVSRDLTMEHLFR